MAARAIALRALEKILPKGEKETLKEDILAEEIANGASWEHLKRKQEMAATAAAAEAATAARGSGGHHMIHFLPKEELAKLSARRAGEPVDESEYQANKLQVTNR